MPLVDGSFITLIISTIAVLLLTYYVLKNKPITRLQKLFGIMTSTILIICIGLIIEKICYVQFGTDPLYFEGVIYIGTCLFPVAFFLFAMVFVDSEVKFSKRYKALFIIPTIHMIAVFTTSYHHLFYKEFAFNMNEMVYGPLVYTHCIYSYGLIALGITKILKYTTKQSGIFSKQSLLIVAGILTSITINLLGSLGIIPMSIYLTPISFSVAVFILSLAIFRFNALAIAPIALQKVVDRMSDCYIVINEKKVIVDFNKTLLNVFKLNAKNVINQDVSIVSEKLKTDEFEKAMKKVMLSSKTITFEIYVESINRYFNVEVSSIVDNETFLGTLILFKDVTQHEEDMKTIKDNQDMLVERERFASLGQMIGGIAHNLKTPIMSIAGAAEALNDLITEYDVSIGDKEVTEEDHHAIAEDMRSWVAKVKTHTAYMSEVITAVKGQAISSNEVLDSFTIEELIKRVSILMKHDLKHSLVDLNYEINIDKEFKLHGSINSLVQVLDNLISNAIQAYGGKPDSVIDFIVDKQEGGIVLSIRDYGCGMTQEVQEKLFKEMITTKGKNGTGLGLFMSYSNIKAKFNGNITFESEVRKRYDISCLPSCGIKLKYTKRLQMPIKYYIISVKLINFERRD